VAIDLDRQSGTARIEVNGRMLELAVGELSDWIELSFKAAPGIKVRGICRMMVTEMGEHFSLYATPINIDPEKPAMPISHPSYYAVYLAKKLGKYATLGLAEDTWALNEGVIDDQTFLRLTYDIDREREEMFFAALDKLRRGTVVCVFDATDRIQHMFWRYLEPDHPAAKNGAKAPSRDAIAELYEHNDALVGRIRARLGAEDVLMVLSDHGFASFRRGLNLNAWLHANGYLALKEGGDGSEEWLRDVDWSRTRAYALGLTGLFLNVEGREAKGIVKSGEEAEALKAELIGRLSGLIDEHSGETAIQEAFDTASLYSGPYLKNGPDVLIGYNVGYRISWDGATGVVEGPIFTDNVKPWSGDHGIDPRLVPGVFFSDRSIGCDDPALIDVAPSALWLFGIQPPSYMDGKVLFTEDFTAVAKER
jgi:predicted AlkP superfamily phosphohydrolase/phosphomutase